MTISSKLFYFVVFAIAIFFGKTVFAELSVKSHNLARNKVLLVGGPQDTEGLNPGYRLTVKLGGDKTCDLEVLERKIDQVTADSSLCPFRNEITAGQIAFKAGTAPTTPATPPTTAAATSEPSQPEQAPAVENAPPSTSKFAFDIGVLYSFIDKYDYKYKTSPFEVKGEGEIESEGTPGLTFGFTYQKAEELPWFIHGALLVEFSRDIEGSFAGINASGKKMTYIAVYGNFNYEVLPRFYLIGGLGLGGLFFSNFEPEMVTDVGGLLNIGIGTHMLDRRIYLELVGRYQTSGAEQEYKGNPLLNEIEYENIDAFGAILTARYAFF